MKSFVLLVLACFLFLNTYAQENLVRNGGFEEYLYCPPIYNHDSFPCVNWYIIDKCSPDYYNSCSKVSEFNYPDTYAGKCTPKSGNGFIGMYMVETLNGTTEHIQCELKKPLEKGKKYEISFWIRFGYEISDFATNNIGVYLSVIQPIFGQNIYWNVAYYYKLTPELSASIHNTSKVFLSDTNWVKISGVYLAKGGEKYLTLGAFYYNNENIEKYYKKYVFSNTDKNLKKYCKVVYRSILQKNKKMLREYKNYPPKLGSKYAYYFFDDVSVIEVE